jgi:hypothetical protein
MSFESEYMKLRKKREEESEKETTGDPFVDEYLALRATRLEKQMGLDDIAPVQTQQAALGGNKEENGQKWYDGWFKSGAFSDNEGSFVGDLAKTILGTFRDVEENVLEAVGVATENIIDSGAELAGQVGGWFGNKDFEEKMYKWANGTDLLQSEQTAKTFSNILNWTNPTGIVSNLVLGNGVTESNAEEYSVLDEKSD